MMLSASEFANIATQYVEDIMREQTIFPGMKVKLPHNLYGTVKTVIWNDKYAQHMCEICLCSDGSIISNVRTHDLERVVFDRDVMKIYLRNRVVK